MKRMLLGLLSVALLGFIAAKKDPGLIFGVSLYSFSGTPYETALKKADSTNSKQIQGLSWMGMGKAFDNKPLETLTPEELTKARGILDQHGLTMSSIFVGGAKTVEGWKRYFEMAKAMGAKQLAGEPPLSQLDVIDSLAGVYKMKFALHEHKRGSSLYWHPYIVLSAMEGHKNIGACADIGHWVRSGLNVVECMRLLEGHILEMHIKDIDENGRDVDLGKGKIDFPAVIGEMKKQQLQAPSFIEFEQRFTNNVESIKKERNWLEQLAK